MKLRSNTLRHESIVARIIMRDFDGNATGDYGDEETFIKVDGAWYPERTIKAGAIGYRDDQLVMIQGPAADEVVVNVGPTAEQIKEAADVVEKGWKETLERGNDQY